MPSSKHLRQIFEFAKSGDMSSFERVAKEIIQEEREKQHHLLANDLEQILYGKTSSKNSLQFMNDVPLNKEKNLPLLEIKKPNRYLADLVLEKQNVSIIERVFLENHKADVLASYGLKPIQKLLFYGSSGCGKTATAEAIAKEIELPFAIVRIDSVISSFLGDTASNLRKIFDYITQNQVVILFDEFDALGRERSDVSEHGEIKRVVNALLQMLDSYEGNSILICATNHEANLDSAIWRRFDEILKFELPNETQIKQLLAIKLRSIRNNFFKQASIFKKFKGLSHADIERILRRAIKTIILDKREILELQDIEESLLKEKARKQESKRKR